MNIQKVFDDYPYGELGHPEMYQQLLPLLKPGQSALDLGFGTGHLCSPVAFAGLTIIGVDTNADWLEEAAELYQKAGLGDLLSTVCQDASEYLRANTKRHNLIIMSDFLMFQMKSTGLELMKLAYEALEPGGYLWIVTASTSDDFYAELASYQEPVEKDTYYFSAPCGGGGLFCFYGPDEIDQYLESFGAKIVFSTETLNSRDRSTIIVLAQKPG